MDAHTSYGVANARDTYGNGDLVAGTGNDPVAYDGIKLGFGTEQGITLGNANATEAGTYFQAVTPQIQTEVGFSEYKELVNLSKGVTKIRVYFWVEGQDVDCENNASEEILHLIYRLVKMHLLMEHKRMNFHSFFVYSLLFLI